MLCDDVLQIIFSNSDYSDICAQRQVCQDWAIAGKERLEQVGCKIILSIEEAVYHSCIVRDNRHLDKMLQTNLDAEQLLRGSRMAYTLKNDEVYNKFINHHNWKCVRSDPNVKYNSLELSLVEFLYKPLSWCVKNYVPKYDTLAKNVDYLTRNRCYRLVRFLIKDKPIPEIIKRYTDLWKVKRNF